MCYIVCELVHNCGHAHLESLAETFCLFSPSPSPPSQPHQRPPDDDVVDICAELGVVRQWRVLLDHPCELCRVVAAAAGAPEQDTRVRWGAAFVRLRSAERAAAATLARARAPTSWLHFDREYGFWSPAPAGTSAAAASSDIVGAMDARGREGLAEWVRAALLPLLLPRRIGEERESARRRLAAQRVELVLRYIASLPAFLDRKGLAQMLAPCFGEVFDERDMARMQRVLESIGWGDAFADAMLWTRG
ncbi:hypothetical protein GGR56DRAFT_696867 [Xylariaceae sp. FL0804]|nr:hypothetical protein GGR56DRAFT_696867 [Xylariaceae sp. FL0804]